MGSSSHIFPYLYIINFFCSIDHQHLFADAASMGDPSFMISLMRFLHQEITYELRMYNQSSFIRVRDKGSTQGARGSPAESSITMHCCYRDLLAAREVPGPSVSYAELVAQLPCAAPAPEAASRQQQQ